MGQLRDRMEADLKLGGYSPSTQKIYLLYARLFVKHHRRSPAEMGEPEVRSYLLHLIEERNVSRETLRQARSALQFLYTVTLRRPAEVEALPVPRRRKPLPVVLSGTEVTALLNAVTVLKYRGVLMAMYASGLRISEACRLCTQDIDSKRMVIRVRIGKGGVDRYTLLSSRLLAFLRQYWRSVQPQGDWLFPGQSAAGHIAPDSARYVFREAIKIAGITKEVAPHVLRHCFATHLLECGVDVTVIQALLGHASLNATQVYTHVSVEHIARIKSPLDLLGTPQAAIFG